MTDPSHIVPGHSRTKRIVPVAGVSAMGHLCHLRVGGPHDSAAINCNVDLRCFGVGAVLLMALCLCRVDRLTIANI